MTEELNIGPQLSHPSNWTNIERGFLQYLIARRVVTENEAREVLEQFQQLEPQHGTIRDFDTTLSMVEAPLRNIGLTVKKRRSQVDRHRVIVLSNTIVDDVTKLTTKLSQPEVELFKMILEAIFGEDNNLPENKFWISKTQFLEDIQQRGAAIARNQLQHLIDDEWVELHDDDRLFPSFRTLAEMEDYLVREFGPAGLQTLNSCSQCSALFTMGYQCSTPGCTTRLHVLCADRYFRQNDSDNCLNCRVNIKDDHIKVGV